MPCRCSAPSRLVTSPACESRVRAWETDGRSAPTSRPSNRCVSGSARRMPPGSTRPQRPARCQSSSVIRTSRRGCEVIARWTSRSAVRAQARASRACEICGQGLTRSANASSSRARRAGTSAFQVELALEQVVGARGERLQHVAVADDLRGGAVAHAHVDAEHAVEDRARRARGRPGRSSARGRRRRPARRTRRPSRPAARRGACAGRAARPDRRRGRADSGRTRLAARRCWTVRAAPATAPCPALKMAVEQRWRSSPNWLREPSRRPGPSRRCTVILRLVYPARKAGNHDYPAPSRGGW